MATQLFFWLWVLGLAGAVCFFLAGILFSRGTRPYLTCLPFSFRTMTVPVYPISETAVLLISFAYAFFRSLRVLYFVLSILFAMLFAPCFSVLFSSFFSFRHRAAMPTPSEAAEMRRLAASMRSFFCSCFSMFTTPNTDRFPLP